MDTYSEIVIKTLGATGYAGLEPGPELTKLLTDECAAAEKAAKLLRNPKLAKLATPLTPAQEMRMMVKDTITSLRELIIAEVREEVLLNAEMSKLCEAEPAPRSSERVIAAPPAQPAPPAPKPSPVMTPKSRARIKIDATTSGGAEVPQCLANNELFNKVTGNLKRIADGTDKTIDDFITERGGRLDPEFARELRDRAQKMDNGDDDDENSATWRMLEKSLRNNLLG